MLARKHVLLDENGAPVYFLEWSLNQGYYKVLFSARPVPTSLPTGWSNPSDASSLTGKAPSLIVTPVNAAWGSLLGLTPGEYPVAASPVAVDFQSNVVPVISPITQIYVVIPWVNDGRYSRRPSTVGFFTPTVPQGDLYNYSPNPPITFRVMPGIYHEMRIELYDQLFRPLRVRDVSGMSANVLLKTQTS
jgi:hypothetical protein